MEPVDPVEARCAPTPSREEHPTLFRATSPTAESVLPSVNPLASKETLSLPPSFHWAEAPEKAPVALESAASPGSKTPRDSTCPHCLCGCWRTGVRSSGGTLRGTLELLLEGINFGSLPTRLRHQGDTPKAGNRQQRQGGQQVF